MKREISSSANGRVNLLGEHLDYNGGAVLPLQIDKCVKIYLSDNNTNEKIVIKSINLKTKKYLQIAHPKKTQENKLVFFVLYNLIKSSNLIVKKTKLPKSANNFFSLYIKNTL